MQVSSTNRERASPFRGHRHYFQKGTAVGRWRTRLSLLALAVSVGWVSARALDKEEMYADVSPGPLIEAHGNWSDRCDVCHIPFGEPGNTSGGLMDCRDRWRAFAATHAIRDRARMSRTTHRITRQITGRAMPSHAIALRAITTIRDVILLLHVQRIQPVFAVIAT